MLNGNFGGDRKKPDLEHNELAKAHYLGAVILIVAASGFLMLIFVLNLVFDFSRFAY
jgi:hypothetical protein